MKLIRNIVIGIILVSYFSLIIFISVLLLNRNDYGMTQFKDDTWILIGDSISNDNYSEGSLVIVEKKKIEELKNGDEVFVYKTDEKEKKVEIIVSKIETVNNSTDENNPYITLQNNGGSWGEDFIAGVSKKVYPKIGGILSFLESKWMFFIFLIVPCFFILIYEIYLAIIEIKYGDMEEVEANQLEKVSDSTSSNDNNRDNETLEDLKKQIELLKKEVSLQKEEIKVTDNSKDDDIEDLDVLEDNSSIDNSSSSSLEKDSLEDTIELL